MSHDGAVPLVESTLSVSPAGSVRTLSGAAHTLTAEWDCTPSGTVTQAILPSSLPMHPSPACDQF